MGRRIGSDVGFQASARTLFIFFLDVDNADESIGRRQCGRSTFFGSEVGATCRLHECVPLPN